ncbi:MAG: hypothetical protein HP494_05755 [Nitrospira sp.]|nr:hypothetical protein [Nitrospira sp.]
MDQGRPGGAWFVVPVRLAGLALDHAHPRLDLAEFIDAGVHRVREHPQHAAIRGEFPDGLAPGVREHASWNTDPLASKTEQDLPDAPQFGIFSKTWSTAYCMQRSGLN